MTVKKLREMLQDKPDNMEVFIKIEDDEYEYSLLNSVKVEKIHFTDGNAMADDDCLVLNDY